MTSLVAVRGFTTEEVILDVDTELVRIVGPYTLSEDEIYDKFFPIHMGRYGKHISLHVVRKRLWRLACRRILCREKGTRTYRLHEKYRLKILEALRR
jgi:hypothetical protein